MPLPRGTGLGSVISPPKPFCEQHPDSPGLQGDCPSPAPRSNGCQAAAFLPLQPTEEQPGAARKQDLQAGLRHMFTCVCHLLGWALTGLSGPCRPLRCCSWRTQVHSDPTACGPDTPFWKLLLTQSTSWPASHLLLFFPVPLPQPACPCVPLPGSPSLPGKQSPQEPSFLLSLAPPLGLTSSLPPQAPPRNAFSPQARRVPGHGAPRLLLLPRPLLLGQVWVPSPKHPCNLPDPPL